MDIFNDERRLKSRVNNLRAAMIVGRQLRNNIRLRTASFSGVKTIGFFYVRENISCRLDIDFEVMSGRAKVILVHKDTMVDVATSTGKEARIVKLDKGFNRLRLVGEKADVKLTLVLTKGITYLDE